MRRCLRVCGVLFVLAGMLAAGLPGSAQAAPADDPVVYFPETGHHVPGLFLDAWHDFGGLPILGYPISEVLERDGLTVQYFERAIMEWHPQHSGTRYEVQLALLGNWLAEGRRAEAAFIPLSAPGSADNGAVRYFAATGHFLSNGFKQYWERHGGLPLFGYPISEEFEEGGYIVQYFERARFEWHPEHRGTVHEILLGHLGHAAAAAHSIDTAAVAQRPDAPEYGASAGPRSIDVPVLMYHNFGVPERRYTISLGSFAEQLDWLQANGYMTVTVAQVYDYMDGFGDLPDKPIVLTFDDGPSNQMAAADELDWRGMVGSFYINTSSQMSDDDIRSLAARGHEIGAHSTSHPFLTQLSDDQLWSQIYDNKVYLEDVTGQSIDFFAYPFGDWDGRVAAVVEEAGYRGALHAWGGRHWSPEKRWREPRIEIDGTMSLERFIYFVEQFG